MDTKQVQYYQDMLGKGRLISFAHNDRLVCFVTYFIMDSDYKEPWSMIEETPNGEFCYIDQYITDKHNDNPRLSYGFWHQFKEHIRRMHPSVKQIRWRHYKGGVVHVYHKDIK